MKKRSAKKAVLISPRKARKTWEKFLALAIGMRDTGIVSAKAGLPVFCDAEELAVVCHFAIQNLRARMEQNG